MKKPRKILNRKKINPSILVYTGVKQKEDISIQLFQYDSSEISERNDYSLNELKDFNNSGQQKWLNIHGIHDSEIIKEICSSLGIHDLAIQDILDVNQRPKFQEYNDYSFFTLKTIIPSDDTLIELEQLSFILGKNYLVSFQERKADYFDHIRARLRNKVGIVRERGSDYLVFLLLESILDNYFKTMNNIENSIEEIVVLDMEKDPSPNIIKSIEHFKRQMSMIKRIIIPIKEFVTKLEREQFSYIEERHIKYYYELKDLCLSLIDDCEQNEVKLESYSNLFFSIQGHRMNQVMKTLTVVATIFIPLTFIAGIYGMNFTNMPELAWEWGYFGVWIIMILILALMLYYFKVKKWF